MEFSYRYFTCPHAKEQTGEDGCCKRYVIEDNLNEIVWSVIRQLLAMTDAFKQKLDKQNNVSRQDNLISGRKTCQVAAGKGKMRIRQICKCGSVYGGAVG